MIWENTSYLWLLLLLPAVIGALWWRGRQMRTQRAQYFGEELFASLRRGFWPLANRFKQISLFAGLFFLIISLAGPKIGTEVREIKRQGVDMLIALDLSASMNAEDVRPSRLEKAKFEINRLIERLRGDRVGLVVFTGEAYLQSPMTLDYSALRLFLEIADTNQMPSSATDFQAAMATSMEAFEALEDDDSNASRVLLIVSDGEDHGQQYKETLEELTSQNISVYTLGVGTEDGTTIPIYEEGTNQLVGYKRDGSGQVVTTSLQSETLRRIANLGNGDYYSIERGNDGIDAFLARIDELEKGEFSSQEYADYKNQYQWMGALALFFIVASVLIPSYKHQK
ncbi:VWA domain-containing protein [Gracilimonas mengyeensis]|uniref:Ca-activated chloride channel family protein n=1 Tax=Gracilimonas mengyeensis TaxID=1302730 RepID=A0A521B9N9_9BACT|nr:VWA domain-containing protein [Gracilimonas mengyeensis]SMO43812.1 Ca-activated chloride channel family protein [Gracilimonas mengyeensis]